MPSPQALERGAGVCLGEGVLALQLCGSNPVSQHVSEPKRGPSPASPTPQECQRFLSYPCNIHLKNIKPLHYSRTDLATQEGIMEEKLHSCTKAVAPAFSCRRQWHPHCGGALTQSLSVFSRVLQNRQGFW